MATLPGNRKATGAAGYPLSVNPLPITMYYDGSIDTNKWPATFNNSNLGLFGSMNYRDQQFPQNGHTFDLRLSGTSSVWTQGTNWPFAFAGGNNGVDISQYTKLQFDLFTQTSSNISSFFGSYPRGQEQTDLAISTVVNNVAYLIGTPQISVWNIGLQVPLCFLGMLSSYNYYQFSIQQGNGPCFFDNVKFVPGNVSWIYTGNPFIAGPEPGWVDASSGTTVSYSFTPKNINANFNALSEPPASPTFSANINGTILSVSSVSFGTILPGMFLFGSGVSSGTQIMSGSGNTWTLNNNNGTIGTESMSAAFLQNQIFDISMTGGGIWRANCPAGFNVSVFRNFTFAALPTSTGYSYIVTLFNTSGQSIGSVSASQFTPNDFGVQTGAQVVNHTVYSIPLSSFGALPPSIGGVSITASQGGLLSAIGFWS